MPISERDRDDWVRGQNPDLDPRLTAARPDIAWSGLKGKIDTSKFVAGKIRTISTPYANLKKTPRNTAPLLTQGLLGEKFRALEEHGGWAFGQLLEDGYVGYIKLEALGAHIPDPSHLVTVPLTHIYARPDLKTPDPLALPFGAKITIREGAPKAGFAEAQGLGWICLRHIARLGVYDKDYVKTASRFLHVPYVWGGKTALGLDCSSLIQLAMTHAGIPCPRDTDQQARSLGHSISNKPDLALCKKGDLVFFKGHAGLMLDGTHLLHANATHMRVTIDDARAVADRLAKEFGDQILDIRRLS